MAEADDVPPLEDMSEMLQQVEQLREHKKKGMPTNGTSHHHIEQNGTKVNIKDDHTKTHSDKTTTKTVKKEETMPTAKSGGDNNGGFGGMKKGFLFGGNSSKSKPKKSEIVNKKQTKKDSDDLTFIKKDEQETSSQFKFPEVEQAMKQTSSLLDNKEWVTDELLENVQKNERLARRLQDPTFARALTEFQTNPQAAALKYQNNPEFQETFQDFCGIMGDHFGKMGENSPGAGAPIPPPKVQELHTKTPGGGADLSVRSSTNPNQPTAEDERKMQDILSNPEIRDIMMDQWIQKLFEKMRTDPVSGQRFLQEADVDKKKKIQKLVDAGLLQFQR
ncbi:uncharacterized protein LOC110465696 [Mizuhopecten yessoensis]|uniref:STI1/HOP DP domain-containing protein n=1 Tax=Mizuhopecten yessoensis TaxID=6573 RepID=A0A210PQZ1_MIZYE|nr:uncharacterized protein LOC110465696 [Mizuhopecten yessoensis]OWF38905.1 hypothetical protein KP79_PYT07612 [Mizuhopecten yessoensis]